GNLARLADSKLLLGLERALQCETYEAAECWFSWVDQASTGSLETIHLELAAEVKLDSYYGYPIYHIAAPGHGHTPERRLEILVELFESYVRTDGNDRSRFLLAEALAFALSRCLGSRGQFEKAISIVDRALSLRSSSIHLKAARHALNLQLQNKL